MKTVHVVLQGKSDAELVQAVSEVNGWRRTGKLPDPGVFRSIAAECGDDFELRYIESEFLMFIAVRWADSVGPSPRAC